jgi:hypothetical protein
MINIVDVVLAIISVIILLIAGGLTYAFFRDFVLIKNPPEIVKPKRRPLKEIQKDMQAILKRKPTKEQIEEFESYFE